MAAIYIYEEPCLPSRLAIALGHDNITIEGDKYLGGIVKDGDYEIDWQKFLDYPTAKAKFSVQITPFDNTNSNCQTCEEAVQLSLEDDTFLGLLEEGQTYEINVSDNDNICCFPAVFSISSFDTDYVETASIDQLGNLSVTMKATFFSGTDISLLVYRVTCPNGGYDEATVKGSPDGEEPECNAPSNLVITSVTSTTAEVDFTPASPVPDHYYWKLYRVSFGSILVQSGEATTPHISLSGLLPSGELGSYDLYVRSQCDTTDNDIPSSDFIHKTFNTNPVSASCGEYILNYNDPFGGPGAHTNGTYLDCNGVYKNIYIPNNITVTICALQLSPGVPSSINPGAANLSHGTDSDCNSMPPSIKIFVGRSFLEGAVCGTSYAVYISSSYSDIGTGITVYSDSALTTPITGPGFIGSLGGAVYHIDTSTGLVGAITGTSC